MSRSAEALQARGYKRTERGVYVSPQGNSPALRTDGIPPEKLIRSYREMHVLPPGESMDANRYFQFSRTEVDLRTKDPTLLIEAIAITPRRRKKLGK